MNGTIAIALGCTTCFILGVTAGMLCRERKIMEMAEAMKDLFEATVEYMQAIKREYGVPENDANERKIRHD